MQPFFMQLKRLIVQHQSDSMTKIDALDHKNQQQIMDTQFIFFHQKQRETPESHLLENTLGLFHPREDWVNTLAINELPLTLDLNHVAF